MKKLLWIFASALLLSNLFLSTGCGEDDPITPDLNPTIAVTAATETVVGTGQTVEFEVIGAKTTNDLQSLTILEDDVQVDDARISITGISLAANPQLITGSDVSGFTWTVTIDMHDSGAKTYTFRLSDTKSNTAEDDVVITVEEPAIEINGVLLNQLGPAGTGAIDLETGVGTGTGPHAGDPTNEYLKADLRDMGLRPGATTGDNWARRIGGINGSEVKYLENPTDADFDNITSKQGVLDAYDAGIALTEELSTVPGVKVSSVVEVGDIFIVKNGDMYFLVRVDAVEETLTLGDNDDNYQLSIKY